MGNLYNSNQDSKAEQGHLFYATDYKSPIARDVDVAYSMSHDSLQTWKQAIAGYQQQVREANPVVQATLFDLAATHCDPDAIDPFSLKLYPFEFYQLHFDGAGETCIYFVIDNAVPLILYIGETIASDRRWKGTHDCKRYVANYLNLHVTHQAPKAICMGFWWDAPQQTKARKQLEARLIARWKPPFNKENWHLWHTPFVD